ncbi:hypothetical protein SAMN05421811_13028 [Nonomuraea wenchangensis]|uniref:Uncharacterized protein n=1 Tax=Nonomuraea wenchangensis TaxID=568860 RepID=A0A1I0LWL5_9ACTN|nr:hypothetical protein SAMN05421811_13028 [Nonomuraea wenchangensis]
MAGDGAFDGLTEVAPQVPPVGDLGGVRRAPGDAFGVGAGPVAADDLDPRVGAQPCGQGVGRPVGQHVHHGAGGDVDQDGAVGVTSPQGEIVHPEHSWTGLQCRVGQGSEQPDQRHSADGGRQPGGEPGSGPSAQRQRDGLQRPGRGDAAAAVSDGQRRDLLGECRLRTRGSAAEEAAYPQVDEHFLAAGCGIGQSSFVAAVHLLRRSSTGWAGGLHGAGCGLDPHRGSRSEHLLNAHAGQMREQDGDQFLDQHAADVRVEMDDYRLERPNRDLLSGPDHGKCA